MNEIEFMYEGFYVEAAHYGDTYVEITNVSVNGVSHDTGILSEDFYDDLCNAALRELLEAAQARHELAADAAYDAMIERSYA